MRRRDFFKAFGAIGLGGAATAACSDTSDNKTAKNHTATTTSAEASNLPTPDLAADPFHLGVASGDPDANSVVLWTRLMLAAAIAADHPEVPVVWTVGRTKELAPGDVVAHGTAVAKSTEGYSVHAIAEGLDPDRWYWFRFQVGSWQTPVARTRTSPAAGKSTEKLSIGVASCQDYQEGYYNAWRDAAQTDLDLIMFLGDYIYEDNPLPLSDRVKRQVEGPEPTTLDQYRARYATYKSDPHLQQAHAHCPWLVVWDDHEVENNYADLHEQTDKISPEEFAVRRAAAYQAWWEHMPVRMERPTTKDLKIYRSIEWGSLASISMLDTRQYRTDQACGDAPLQLNTPACPEVTAPGRTLMGDEQERWLLERIRNSTATWNVIGNQVVMTDLRLQNGTIVVNYDQWDGYPAERDRLLQAIRDAQKRNVVVLTGDIHLAGVGDLQTADAAGAKATVATEFVGTSISSGGLIPPSLEEMARKLLPDVKYFNAHQRGWIHCTVTPDEWLSEYRVVADNLVENSPLNTDARFKVTPGTPGAVPA
jgi:alkaline phosphatase D